MNLNKKTEQEKSYEDLGRLNRFLDESEKDLGALNDELEKCRSRQFSPICAVCGEPMQGKQLEEAKAKFEQEQAQEETYLLREIENTKDLIAEIHEQIIEITDRNKTYQQDMEKATTKGWIARDADGDLWIYCKAKPTKQDKTWESDKESLPHPLPDNIFTEVKWEDNEPTEAVITIQIRK